MLRCLLPHGSPLTAPNSNSSKKTAARKPEAYSPACPWRCAARRSPAAGRAPAGLAAAAPPRRAGAFPPAPPIQHKPNVHRIYLPHPQALSAFPLCKRCLPPLPALPAPYHPRVDQGVGPVVPQGCLPLPAPARLLPLKPRGRAFEPAGWQAHRPTVAMHATAASSCARPTSPTDAQPPPPVKKGNGASDRAPASAAHRLRPPVALSPP